MVKKNKSITLLVEGKLSQRQTSVHFFQQRCGKVTSKPEKRRKNTTISRCERFRQPQCEGLCWSVHYSEYLPESKVKGVNSLPGNISGIFMLPAVRNVANSAAKERKSGTMLRLAQQNSDEKFWWDRMRHAVPSCLLLPTQYSMFCFCMSFCFSASIQILFFYDT